MTPTTSAVHAHGLSVRLGGRHSHPVLEDLDFEVPAGSITGLLGPSGSGKTTLMRAIVGVQTYRGTLEVSGTPAGAATLRGRIGYVTQNGAVYPDLSVRQNLEYFAALAGDRSHTGPDTVMHTLGIADLSHRTVADLSGGQRGRVSLGCALVGDPELLVMDEPTVGLDPVTRRALWTELHRIADTGASLLVSSHVLEEAARCDNLILLRDGRILWTGTPGDLLEQTATTNYEDAFLAALGEGNPR